MSQEQRDGEQPWVLAGGQAGHTADEHVEVVTDVEFFEQGVQQPSRQREAARAFGQRAKVIEAAVSSPVDRPGRAPASRSSPVGSCFVGVWIRRAWQTPPAERPALGAEAATCATAVARGG